MMPMQRCFTPNLLKNQKDYTVSVFHTLFSFADILITVPKVPNPTNNNISVNIVITNPNAPHFNIINAFCK